MNAYEDHNHVYEQLERLGGKVLIRGRGIVASRVVQRLYEARNKNKNITVLHLMRSPKPQGNKFQKAQRSVKNHYEFQPFNWPKACWGGELRAMLEKASPEERKTLLADWGGTTTADRSDWQRIAEAGLREGWYKIQFGKVSKVERDQKGRTITYIEEQGFGQMTLDADFCMIPILGFKSSIAGATRLLKKVQLGSLFWKGLGYHANYPDGKYSIFKKDPEFVIGADVSSPQTASTFQ